MTLTKQKLEEKLADTEQKLSQTKNSLNTAIGEKNKNEKIIEMLNKDLAELKNEGARVQTLVAEHEKNGEELRDSIKKLKEDILKGEMRGNGIQKQYDRFK